MQDFSDIVRVEDLPYFYSPPMQFVFTEKAEITNGTYPFTGNKEIVDNNKNITDNTLLYIKAMSFSADIEKKDYQQALKLADGSTNIPSFSCFMQSDAQAPIFVDPIKLGDYFDDQEYKKIVLPKQFPNNISAFFRGTLKQTGALAGVTEINLTMNIWVQQITDIAFIDGLRQAFPRIDDGGLH